MDGAAKGTRGPVVEVPEATDQMPLGGYTVIDLSTGVPGAYCTKLLSDAGALVVKVEAPDGDPLRRWSASGAPLRTGEDGALFTYLSGAKRSVVADAAIESDLELIIDLCANADAVVWSAGSPVAEHPALAPAAVRQRLSHVDVVTITPFGLEGPWAGRPATEFTLQAWAGTIAQRGDVDRPPVYAAGRIGEWESGLFAAVGLLVARQRSRDTGRGELVDVSMLDSLVLATSEVHPSTFWSMLGRPFTTSRARMIPAIEPTSDGWVGFNVATGQQWLDFCVLVERPQWAEDAELIVANTRRRRSAELNADIRRWTSARTTDEVLELAGLLRIPVAPVSNGATVAEHDHFRSETYFQPCSGRDVIQPAAPYRLGGGARGRRPGPAPSLGEHTEEQRSRRPSHRSSDGWHRSGPPSARRVQASVELPFEGLRVADFTAWWAGPIVGHVLAMLGAEVVHVESPTRPDAMRFTGVSRDRDQWWERGPFFAATNTNKLDLGVELSTDRGRAVARRLIEHCDVVIENFSPRVFESWGFADREQFKDDLIVVRMPAFGLSGPWRDRTGYAPTIEQASGLCWITGYADRPPLAPNGFCDANAGYHALFALQLALEHRRRTGRGMLLEVPMVLGALNVAAEQVLEYFAYGVVLERDGNRGPVAVQNLYLSADVDPEGRRDRWVAVAIEDDAHWAALRSALGRPVWAEAPELQTSTGRRRHQDVVDRELTAWCAQRASTTIVDTLWSAGVPTGLVLMSHEQSQVPQLASRGFFEEVDHPVTGRHPYAGLPMRFSSGPSVLHRRRSPLLGEHNEEVLRGWLGMSTREISDLEAERVIGTRPLGA